MAVPFDERSAREMCEAAADRNRATGITGLLACDRERFLQVLEGEAGAVTSLMGRIRRDPRHDSLAVLSSRTIRTFEFGSTPMQFIPVGAETDEASLLQRMGAALSTVSDPAIKAIFIGFAKLGAHRHHPAPPNRCLVR